ncbi:MAG: VOC family protein [Actinobacteria bacterium]|nr:VOC family protein [Actinomycetota bacterium]
MNSLRTRGVDHIGVGVSDLDASRAFYGELGFTEAAFEHSGPLPGLEAVAGRSGVEAEVVMLRNPHEGPLGLAGVKLVHVTDSPVPPLPEGMGWGEPGVSEVCVHVRDEEALYRRLVEELGVTSLMEPVADDLPPDGVPVKLSYVADPDGGKVELLEWPTLDAGWPREPGPQGVNHVAFGVADIAHTRDFWRRLGFDSQLFESDGFFEPMDPWYPGPAPRQRMMLLMNPHGAGMEPVQHFPPSADMRGEWGRLGPMEFAVGVTNLDLAVEAMTAAGIEFRGDPQTVELDSGGSWRYAYFVDPDRNYVYLSETRY